MNRVNDSVSQGKYPRWKCFNNDAEIVKEVMMEVIRKGDEVRDPAHSRNGETRVKRQLDRDGVLYIVAGVVGRYDQRNGGPQRHAFEVVSMFYPYDYKKKE